MNQILTVSHNNAVVAVPAVLTAHICGNNMEAAVFISEYKRIAAAFFAEGLCYYFFIMIKSGEVITILGQRKMYAFFVRFIPRKIAKQIFVSHK